MNNSQLVAGQKAKGLMRLRMPLILGLILNALFVAWIPVSQLFLAPRVVAQEAPREEPTPLRTTATDEPVHSSDSTQTSAAPVEAVLDKAQDPLIAVDVPKQENLAVDLSPALTSDDADAYVLAPETTEVPPEPPRADEQLALLPATSNIHAPVRVAPLEPELIASLVGNPPHETTADDATPFQDLFAEDAEVPRVDHLHDPNHSDPLAPTRTTEIATDEVLIRNPVETNGAVHFLVNGETVSLQPGESYQIRLTGQEMLLQFHRGGQFGEAEHQLSPGVFDFAVSYETGWMLQPSDSPVASK